MTVVLDCVRWASVASLGDPRSGPTPELDRLVQRGATTFTHAVAPGNWTVPSHMSILTGTYPWVHRRRTFQRGDAPMETIATWLKRRGYATAMFSEEAHLTGGYGLESGYESLFGRRIGSSDEDRTTVNRTLGHAQFLYSARFRRLLERLPALAVPLTTLNFAQEAAYKREVCGDYLLEDWSRWLAGRPADRPFHAFFNFVDGHEPYPELAGGFRDRFSARGYAQIPRFYLLAVPGLKDRVPWDRVRAAYHRAIAEADRKVGRLLAALEAAGELDRTWVFVTSDHGQSFGEGGNVYHGCGASDSVLRVPLWVWGPTEPGRPKRVDHWVTLCDVPSWMKSVALGRPAFDAAGRPSVPFPVSPPDRETILAEGGPASDPNRSLLGIRTEELWNRRQIAAYRGREKWTIDLTSGDVRYWPEGDRGLPTLPEPLGSHEATAARHTVFGIFGREDIARYVGDGSELARDSLDDARMKSWGYD
ncbi:MAG: sulfatase-like hydrolase/transferase [Thermoplasmata archaeon]|nr:sulfatase-like hydrolase/transferase [Thermoplasmata archaeon]MCI4356017.1 sulfatase-like hydrolase/transferase [Thermoplasmata archaeon]